MVKKTKRRRPKTEAGDESTERGTTATGTARKTTRRNLANPRPRETEDFDFGANSRPSSRVPKDDRTIKQDAPSLELVRPSWNGKSGTVIRPLPCFDIQITDDDVFMSSRRSAKRDHMSDWIRGYPAVKYIGIDTKLTFILFDPREANAGRYDPSTNPYSILYRAVEDAVEDSEAMIVNKDVLTNKWAPLVGRGQKQAFSYKTFLYFMQGLIYQHNGEVLVKKGRPRGLRDKDWPQIIELSKTGAESMLELLSDQVDGNFDSDDYNQFKYPDVTSLTEGFFVTIYNPDKHSIDLETSVEPDAEAEEDDFGEASGTAEKKKSREFKGWKASISDTYVYSEEGAKKKAKRDLTKVEDEIREKILWWNNVIHVPTHEEICMFCATAYRSMPDLLHYGWQENPEFFTDEVKGILAARTSGPGAEVPPMEEDDLSEPVDAPSKAAQSLPELDDDEEYEEIDVDAEEENRKRAAAASAASRSSKRRKKKKTKGTKVKSNGAATKRPPKKTTTSSESRKKVPRKKKKKKVSS